MPSGLRWMDRGSDAGVEQVQPGLQVETSWYQPYGSDKSNEVGVLLRLGAWSLSLFGGH